MEHPVIFPKVTAKEPIPGNLTVFTDGSSSRITAIVSGDQNFSLHTPYTSAQLVELTAIIMALQRFPSQSLNIISDSHYIGNSIPSLETAGSISPSTLAFALFAKIQQLLWL